MSNTIYVHISLHTCATLWLYSIKSKLSQPKWLRLELNYKVMLLFNCNQVLYLYTRYSPLLWSKQIGCLTFEEVYKSEQYRMRQKLWLRYNLPENGEYNKALYYFQFILFKNSFCHHFTNKTLFLKTGWVIFKLLRAVVFQQTKIIKSLNFWNYQHLNYVAIVLLV